MLVTYGVFLLGLGLILDAMFRDGWRAWLQFATGSYLSFAAIATMGH